MVEEAFVQNLDKFCSDLDIDMYRIMFYSIPGHLQLDFAFFYSIKYMELNDLLFKPLVDLFLVEFNYDSDNIKDAEVYTHNLSDNNTFLNDSQ